MQGTALPRRREKQLCSRKNPHHYLAMAVAFFSVNSESGLKKLDEYLLTRSYITGYQASKDDITVHAALSKPPPSEYVNVARWYNHIEALLRISGVSGEGCGVTIEGSAPVEAVATPPVADAKTSAAEDDDVDLFGEETEEEKKAAEERAAAVKASGKKKESGKSSVLMDVKPWDDETDNVRAGYDYDEETFEKIFKRIYSTFGSSAPYTIFPDSQPFLRWVRERGIKVGIVSNAEYRYQDVILPALGLNKGSEWDFGVFSGLEGVEKPDPRIYEIALERAGVVAPEEALHIGDSMRKDYLPATSVGMHALLLDRFKIPDAENWRKSGAPVLDDLVAVQEWLTSEKLTL